MDAKDIVRSIIKKEGFTQEKLAHRSGMKAQSNVTGVLNRGTGLRVDTLDTFLRAMGWKIVVMPESVNVRENWHEVTTEPPAPGSEG